MLRPAARRRAALLSVALGCLLAVAVASAQDDASAPEWAGNATDPFGPDPGLEESVDEDGSLAGAEVGTTTIVILLVLAVVALGLIVALSARRP